MPAFLLAPTDNLRDEGGFRRGYDGHVSLLSRDGIPVEVRLDAKMPGTVLLRDQQGYVYFITFNNVQQVGLRFCNGARLGYCLFSSFSSSSDADQPITRKADRLGMFLTVDQKQGYSMGFTAFGFIFRT